MKAIKNNGTKPWMEFLSDLYIYYYYYFISSFSLFTCEYDCQSLEGQDCFLKSIGVMVRCFNQCHKSKILD